MSRALYDPWTGKPVDRLSDYLPSLAGYQCDECGAEVISRCGRCGAPQCCPRCCFEAEEAWLAASADTLPKGQDAKQGLAGTEGSAVGEAETPNPS